ncbi:MAG: hypothetical protein IEMM0008_1280 [bacterium]|nr:MAG: hypothetical protein IEMM0008_1280 [bacterium]
MEEKRKYERRMWFDTIYHSGDVVRPIGLIFNISQEGANVWIDYSKTDIASHFTVRLRPPGGVGILGYVDFNVNQIWSEKTNTLAHQNLGCQFESLTASQNEQLGQLLHYFLRLERSKALKEGKVKF